MKKYKIIFNEEVEGKLDDIFNFIFPDSKQNAFDVIVSIEKVILSLQETPKRFPKISEKIGSSRGDIRNFFCKSFRIVYLIDGDYVRVLDIRHGSREPLKESDFN